MNEPPDLQHKVSHTILRFDFLPIIDRDVGLPAVQLNYKQQKTAKTKQNNTLALESESYISPLFYREVCREFENEELNFSDDAKYHDRFVPVYFRKPSPYRRIQTYILHIH